MNTLSTADEVRSFLEDCLERGVEPGRVLHIALPAPRACIEVFLEGAPRNLGFIWYPQTGMVFAGIGATHRIDVHGPERFQQLRERVDALWRRLQSRSFPNFVCPTARVFGGLAFAAGVNDEPPWSDFSDGCFTLPRWCYGHDGDVTFLTLALNGDSDMTPGWRARVIAEYDAIFQALDADRLDPDDRRRGQRETFAGEYFGQPPDIEREAVEQQSIDCWRGLIDDIHTAIRKGEFKKIVAARRSYIEARDDFDDIRILTRLAHEYKACYRFAFRREESTFLGASPERLFRKRGLNLDTQALAGTIVAGGLDDATDAGQSRVLLRSKKDRAEHEIVVDEILRQLGPLCPKVEAAEVPQVRKFRNLLHLNTHIAGELRPNVHAIDVLARLHPTPAVGGLPSQNAVDWITQHEVHPRGWYTGPVGWLGADGDAEFVVAIRSGIVSGTDAFIYAGAGVVAASTAEKEYFETEIKQEPLLRALGVEP